MSGKRGAEGSFGSRLDAEFKKDFVRLCELANETVCKTPREAALAFKAAVTGRHGRLAGNAAFSANPEREALHSKIVQRTVRLLGTKAGDDKEVSETLWRTVVDSMKAETQPPPVPLNLFIRAIEGLSAANITFVAPNHLIALPDGIARISIGPVDIVGGELAASELNVDPEGQNWIASVGNGPTESQGKWAISIPQHCWLISVKASKNNAPEEGAWLALVATSFLRLAAFDTLEGRVPRYDDVEAHPFDPVATPVDYVMCDHPMITSAPRPRRHRYLASYETAAKCSLPAFIKAAKLVFNPPSKSVAVRVAQGLGWLARGRQTEDRADRFLYFFTAVEALLSSDDKSAPVIQTIARHAACILADEPASRAHNAKIIRNLYGSRSALIHAGAREVSGMDMRGIHNIAESLFVRVLQKVDLATPLNTFHEELQAASYGDPWREDATDHPLFS